MRSALFMSTLLFCTAFAEGTITTGTGVSITIFIGVFFTMDICELLSH